MTLNRFYQNYIESNGLQEYRFVNLGTWTYDIKKLYKFLTDDPDNKEMHRIVMRGQSHLRQRPQNSRFVVGSKDDSLTQLSITDHSYKEYGGDWLG